MIAHHKYFFFHFKLKLRKYCNFIRFLLVKKICCTNNLRGLTRQEKAKNRKTVIIKHLVPGHEHQVTGEKNLIEGLNSLLERITQKLMRLKQKILYKFCSDESSQIPHSLLYFLNSSVNVVKI